MFELQLLLTSALGSVEIQITSYRQRRATGTASVLSTSRGYESEISRHHCFFSRYESDIAPSIQGDSKEKSVFREMVVLVIVRKKYSYKHVSDSEWLPSWTCLNLKT